MKRLSYSSTFALAFLLATCGSQEKAVNDPPLDETTKERGDTTGGRREAPPHNAPDQDRIDSLKREKLKEKQ